MILIKGSQGSSDYKDRIPLTQAQWGVYFKDTKGKNKTSKIGQWKVAEFSGGLELQKSEIVTTLNVSQEEPHDLPYTASSRLQHICDP